MQIHIRTVPQMVKPLIVFKASAGSGKTFTLAVEYIKLLVQNPQAFRQTLAVTFTNKATAEMKERILSQLYGIWRGYESSRDYSDKVCKELGVSPEYAAKQAGIALHLLLHNYSYFRVETIDSFFQSVLRNLARELDLTANLRVDLNDVQVEEQAVDQLIESLKATDLLLQWLLKYIMETIGDDRSWNVIWQIKKFGRTIFRDFYKQQSKQINVISDKQDFFDNYTQMLRAERAKAAERIKNIADTFFDTIAVEGLTIDDFSNKSRGVCAIFMKMRNGQFDESILTKTVLDAVGNPAKWYTKTSQHAEHIHALVESELDRLLRQAVEEQPRQWMRYQSATLTLRHLSQLRLLGTIEKQVRKLNEASNRFLLSDTQQLLHDLIKGSDSPFIFEKIGARLEHIMIDEFQDTSTVQWKNFKVLLEEAMSHANTSNLIVGDVKQSIYRWRSGDWRLLANIKDEFQNADKLIQTEPLDTNYRSEPNIIRFNNAFFEEAAKTEQVSAYGDVEQHWPKSKKDTGLVKIRLLADTDYKQAMLDATTNEVAQLMQRGIALRHIAILVRSNANIPLIANYLMKQMPDITVVSDEAFRLDASPAVQVIIQALRLLVHPDDAISMAFLAKAYTGRLDGQLPAEYTDNRAALLQMPLYDLTERLYGIFNPSPSPLTSHPSPLNQSGYLCAFFDQVAAFANNNTADINMFLKEWDTSICGKTIQSQDVNGIRIISIHKSKGLEFDHVIIPFCDWRMEFSDILWCHPTEAPYCQLPLVPVDFSQKGMKGTVYEDDYNEEHQQIVVDNLNLIYVAFTRASQSLCVFGRRSAKSSRSALIEDVLPKLKLKDAVLEGLNDEKGPLTFTYGKYSLECRVDSVEFATAPQDNPVAVANSTLYTLNSKPKEPNPFKHEAAPIPVTIEVFRQKTMFKQSNKSMDFVHGEDEDPTQSNYIQLGNVLHNVFAHIRTADDIDAALLQMELDGIIYDSHITRERLETMIRKRMEDPRVAEWFDGKWRLYNECTILLPDGQERRPDRVITNGQQTIVIDFKFGRQDDEHHDQVREYMDLLSQMGHQHVKGFLWYVYSNRIVEVTPSTSHL